VLLQFGIIAWLLIERFGRRRAEAQSQNLSLEVMHLNRAAEAGALSASFAHDLGQPLVSIALNAERARQLLDADRPEIGKLKEAVFDIKHAQGLAAEIIGRFRRLLGRRSDPDIQETDLNAVIADALTILAPEARQRQAELRVEGHRGPLPVRADPVHLLQVLLNLATNAMDAMGDQPVNLRRIVIRTTLRQASDVEVTVSDTGPGIPEQKLRRIFDTFYTTKEHGTGLGLAIARTIVEAYGGTIWAENRTEGGAEVHFVLPLRAERPVRSPSRPDMKTAEAVTAA
jgi:signal transduction histidine kinase